LINLPLLRGDDDRVQPIAFLSTELLHIRIRDRLRSCGTASRGRRGLSDNRLRRSLR
jgi:hypothetical protein